MKEALSPSGRLKVTKNINTLEGLPLGADGVMVPFRPEARAPTGKTRWREIKVGVLARLSQHRTRTGQVVTRLAHRRLVAVLGDIEMLTPRLWLEAVRQGILSAPQVVWRSDGGRGLWRLFDERFVCHATGVLDFYHAAHNLWKAAAAWLDGRTTQARRWLTWARHRLRHGKPDGVLADLADALDVEGLPATARNTLTTVYTYLERHREHINYARYKELGWKRNKKVAIKLLLRGLTVLHRAVCSPTPCSPSWL